MSLLIVQDFEITFFEEWNRITQTLTDNIISSMNNRYVIFLIVKEYATSYIKSVIIFSQHTFCHLQVLKLMRSVSSCSWQHFKELRFWNDVLVSYILNLMYFVCFQFYNHAWLSWLVFFNCLYASISFLNKAYKFMYGILLFLHLIFTFSLFEFIPLFN